MPYIDKPSRYQLAMRQRTPKTAGELNFLVTHLCHQYMDIHGENYQHYNDVIGALEGAKLELYRRKIAPYEDKKIEENGDV